MKAEDLIYIGDKGEIAMEYRRLGRTEFKVSCVGMGGIPLQRITEEEAIATIDKGYQLGVNFIDTARGYTISEELIGKAVEKYRDKIILATKSMARDKESMAKDVEISLRNLRTDYIDLYQFHLIKTQEELEKILGPNGAMEALLDAKKAGKIKEIGITCHNDKILEKAIEANIFSTIQFPYNIIETQGEELFKRAREKDMGVIIMKPIAGGAIRDPQLSLRFILDNPNVTTVIPGVDNTKQVEENVMVGVDRRSLTREELQDIQRERDELGNSFCRRCGYCLPCSEAIDIPTMFLLEGYYTRYKMEEWAKTRYEGVSNKASKCIECGVCEEKCPYNLPIREMLKKVTNVFSK